jgi:hypothetical protein
VDAARLGEVLVIQGDVQWRNSRLPKRTGRTESSKRVIMREVPVEVNFLTAGTSLLAATSACRPPVDDGEQVAPIGRVAILR